MTACRSAPPGTDRLLVLEVVGLLNAVEHYPTASAAARLHYLDMRAALLHRLVDATGHEHSRHPCLYARSRRCASPPGRHSSRQGRKPRRSCWPERGIRWRPQSGVTSSESCRSGRTPAFPAPHWQCRPPTRAVRSSREPAGVGCRDPEVADEQRPCQQFADSRCRRGHPPLLGAVLRAHAADAVHAVCTRARGHRAVPPWQAREVQAACSSCCRRHSATRGPGLLLSFQGKQGGAVTQHAGSRASGWRRPGAWSVSVDHGRRRRLRQRPWGHELPGTRSSPWCRCPDRLVRCGRPERLTQVQVAAQPYAGLARVAGRVTRGTSPTGRRAVAGRRARWRRQRPRRRRRPGPARSRAPRRSGPYRALRPGARRKFRSCGDFTRPSAPEHVREPVNRVERVPNRAPGRTGVAAFRPSAVRHASARRAEAYGCHGGVGVPSVSRPYGHGLLNGPSPRR